MTRLVLSLCDISGIWSAPYVAAGYNVMRVDLSYPSGRISISKKLTHIGGDVLTIDLPKKPYAVLAAPPCTCFCRPGARWWNRHDLTGQTERDVALFRRCVEVCWTATGWWALENPPGRHKRLMPDLGPQSWSFNPWEFGDPWHKQTYIWGTAVRPFATQIVSPPPTIRTPNGHTQGVIARMSSSWKAQRSKTPPGFAAAFFKVNP